METLNARGGKNSDCCPHSLGKLIEWKPAFPEKLLEDYNPGPHSLGKLIEWKRWEAAL